MKKLITTAVAAGLMLGTTASATAAPAIDRDAALVAADAEGLGQDSAWLIVLLFAAIAAGIILLIEDNEEVELPTSP